MPDALRGVLDRSAHYFRSVYLRIVRGLDYLSSRDDWDGKTLLLTGRSQGGGLALVGAGLDRRVTGIVCAVPALCELGAEKYGRPASWPRNVHADEHDYGAALGAQTIDGHGPPSEIARRVSSYFDAVNFCRRARCPAVVALGMVDTCVPPTCVFSALNCLESSSLTVIAATDRGHNADGDPRYRRDDFLCEMAERGGSRLLRAGAN